MFVCKICERKFDTNQGLVSHLTFPGSSCKSNIKDYYDKFLKKPNEGSCKYCGAETYFLGLSKGYLSNICGKCNRKNIDKNKNKKRSASIKKKLKEKRELMNTRKKLISSIRKLTIIPNNKFQCQICGLTFNGYRSITKHIKIHKVSLKDYYNTYFKTQNENICLCYKESPSCKKYTRFISLEMGYSEYCSTKCLSISPLVREKAISTSIKKYGVLHPTKNEQINRKQKDGIRKAIKYRKNDIIEKRKKTVNEKYGVDFISQSDYIKEKVKRSLELYIKTEQFTSKKKEVYNKYLETNFIPKMNVILENRNLELLEEYKGAHLFHLFRCKKCSSIYKRLWNSVQQDFYCPTCNNWKSKAEHELVTWLKDFIDFIENDRQQISPYELDIYVPNNKIAIEYCGLYYHSELVNTKNPETYHLNKMNLCLEKGIRLIQIFEDEWMFNKELVKKRILHILSKNNSDRIFARKCVIKEIDSSSKNTFLDKNHLQGRDSSSIKLGAFFNDKLLSVMTFSKGRLNKGKKATEDIWELNRFANDYEYIVPGIASKLLKYFQRNYTWKKIYSYADLRWSDGRVYEKLGFNLKYVTRPGYWYFKNYKRIHRFNLRKRPDEPKDIPEWALRHEQGFFRIWDCGHLKFEMINPDF